MNLFVDIEYPAKQDVAPAPTEGLQEIKKPYQGKKRGRKPLQRPKIIKQNDLYHWSDVEHHRYLVFLSKNAHLFELSLAQRKRKKVHQLMSNHVKARDAFQCRSHHQKMLSRFGSIDGILSGCLPESPIMISDSNVESTTLVESQQICQERTEGSRSELDFLQKGDIFFEEQCGESIKSFYQDDSYDRSDIFSVLL